MGQRRPSPPNPELEALLDEQLALKVELVLLEERPHLVVSEINRVKKRLAELERLISQHWKNPNA